MEDIYGNTQRNNYENHSLQVVLLMEFCDRKQERQTGTWTTFANLVEGETLVVVNLHR